MGWTGTTEHGWVWMGVDEMAEDGWMNTDEYCQLGMAGRAWLDECWSGHISALWALHIQPTALQYSISPLALYRSVQTGERGTGHDAGLFTGDHSVIDGATTW